MIDFIVAKEKCTACGLCVSDCPAMIIEMGEEIPFIKPENEKKCYRCQHCLAICPEEAVSILGFKPENSPEISEAANTKQLDALLRNRRTVRKFAPGNINPEKLQTVIKAAANAPTGKNSRLVMLTVFDNEKDMAALKEILISKIEKADKEGRLQGSFAAFATRAKLFREGKDFIFRNAPHLIIASIPKDSPTPQADGVIALTYAELMASTLDIGVIWAGFVMWLFDLFPETAQEIGIPHDHQLSYALLMGNSAVKYARGVQRDDISLNLPRLV